MLPLENDKKRLAELKESDIYVYDIGGVVAYGALFNTEIRALFVHPSSRGEGVGKQLLAFLLNKAPSPTSLYVAKSNLIAKKLYSSYGFKIVREFQASYNGTPVLANKMLRKINNINA